MKAKNIDTQIQKEAVELASLPEELNTAIIEATYLREELELKEAEILAYLKKNKIKR